MLQVNAFNFPVWAPLEKLAQALMAGMPTLIKPATPTAYLTERLVRIITAAEYPPGAIQMIAGSARPALDLLGEQDVVSFTGSAATAAALRTHPNVVAHSVRFNAEADSVNAIVLAPDVKPGSPLFAAFVREVISEMTVKAGQKCTAIRRILVPNEFEPRRHRRDRVGTVEVSIGNPASEGVQMGSVVSLDHREDVRRAVREIAKAGRLVHGDPDKVELVDADAQRGAFLDTILISTDGDQHAPHEVEPFGPVASILSYRDTFHAAELVARGRGSLAASLVSDDLAWTTALIQELAPWHGRLHILDSDDMDQTTGHGRRYRPCGTAGPVGRRRVGDGRDARRRGPDAAHRASSLAAARRRTPNRVNPMTRQPLLGIASTLVVVAISFAFIALFDGPTLTGWISYYLMCTIPAGLIVGVIWADKYPTFAVRYRQPLRGIVLLTMALAVGLAVAAVHFFTVGGAIDPPLPILIQHTIVSVVVAMWMTIIWDGWPFTRIRNPFLAGLGLLIGYYVVAYVVFRTFVGVFDAVSVVGFCVTAAAVKFLMLHFELWPLSRYPVLMRQPVSVWSGR